MLPAPDPVRLVVPAAPAAPPPAAFPWVATVAPVAMAVVLFVATGSPYTLMFAALGPIVAVGSAIDARRGRRRSTRASIARDAAELARLAERAEAASEPRTIAFSPCRRSPAPEPCCWAAAESPPR